MLAVPSPSPAPLATASGRDGEGRRRRHTLRCCPARAGLGMHRQRRRGKFRSAAPSPPSTRSPLCNTRSLLLLGHNVWTGGASGKTQKNLQGEGGRWKFPNVFDSDPGEQRGQDLVHVPSQSGARTALEMQEQGKSSRGSLLHLDLRQYPKQGALGHPLQPQEHPATGQTAGLWVPKTGLAPSASPSLHQDTLWNECKAQDH